MSTEENKGIVHRYFEALNQESLALLDELCNPDCLHRAGWVQSLSLEDFKKVAANLFAIFPNNHFGIDEIVAEGETVVVRWTYHAIHAGEYMGVAGTGKPVTALGVNFFRVRNGKIHESWELWDRLGLQQQLGAKPVSGPSASEG